MSSGGMRPAVKAGGEMPPLLRLSAATDLSFVGPLYSETCRMLYAGSSANPDSGARCDRWPQCVGIAVVGERPRQPFLL